MAVVSFPPDQLANPAGWDVTGSGSVLDTITDGDDNTYVTPEWVGGPVSGGHARSKLNLRLYGHGWEDGAGIRRMPGVPSSHRLRRMRVVGRISTPETHSGPKFEVTGAVTGVWQITTPLTVLGRATEWQLLYGNATMPFWTGGDPVVGQRAFVVTDRGPQVPRPQLHEVEIEFETVAPPDAGTLSIVGAAGGVAGTASPTYTWQPSAELEVVGRHLVVMDGHRSPSSPADISLRDVPRLVDDDQPTAENEFRPEVELPDGDYTVWVRIWQDVGGRRHWSSWVRLHFEVETTPPGVPSLSVRGWFDPSTGTVPLLVEDANVPGRSAETATIQRRDPDGTWTTVADEVELDLWHVDVDDRFPPLGVEVVYRARARRMVGVEPQVSDWSDELEVTVPARRWQLTTVVTPELDGPVTVLGGPDVRERPAERFVPLPDGAAGWVRPVVRYGQPGGLDGPLVVDAEDDAERVRLEGLYQLASPVCVRDEGGRIWWATLVGWSERRTPGNRIWTVTFDTVEVDAPDVVVR